MDSLKKEPKVTQNLESYRIRKATAIDAHKLLEYLQALREEELPQLPSSRPLPSEQEEVGYIEQHSGERGRIFVAESTEGLIGVLSVEKHEPPELAHGAMVGMSVARKWRRQGVGRALLAEAIKWAQITRIKRVELEVLSNNAPAQKFYEKVGFTVEGIKKEAVLVSGVYADLILMCYYL